MVKATKDCVLNASLPIVVTKKPPRVAGMRRVVGQVLVQPVTAATPPVRV